MKRSLRDIIQFGLCSFDAGIERDIDGYGYLIGRKPKEPCPTVCEYCRQQADYIATLILQSSESGAARLIEDGKNVDKQSD